MLRKFSVKRPKKCPFPIFCLPTFHVIFHIICFFINENITKNNWLQKFENFSEKILWSSSFSKVTSLLSDCCHSEHTNYGCDYCVSCSITIEVKASERIFQRICQNFKTRKQEILNRYFTKSTDLSFTSPAKLLPLSLNCFFCLWNS